MRGEDMRLEIMQELEEWDRSLNELLDRMDQIRERMTPEEKAERSANIEMELDRLTHSR